MPAYNEADGISSWLIDLDEGFNVASEIYDHWPFTEMLIIVVDDGSKDETVNILNSVKNRLTHNLEIVVKGSNDGHGPSSVIAYQKALISKPDVITFVDGDGQFNVNDVFAVAYECAIRKEIAIGVRRNRVDPIYRLLITNGLKALLLVTSRKLIPDVNSPLRCYPHNQLSRFSPYIPNNTRIPNIFLTYVQSISETKVNYIEVQHRSRRGNSQVGTTWQLPSRRISQVLIPQKFLVFVLKSLQEFFAGTRQIRNRLKNP